MTNNKLLSLLIFAFFKAITFGSVLLFYYFGFSKEYIVIEQAIATANILAPLLLLGITTSFSHSRVVQKSFQFDWIYWSHFMAVFLLTTAGSVILFLFDSKYQVVLIFLSIYCSARLYSQKYKVVNDVIFSSMVDAIPYILICFVFILVYAHFDLNDSLIFCFIFFSISVLAVLVREIVKNEAIKSNEVLKFYSFSGGAFLVSSIVSGAMLAPRALSDFLFEGGDLELFLLTMRFGGVAVLFYQFVYIKCFSDIYRLPKEKIFTYTLVLFSLSAVFVALILFLLVKLEFIYSGKFIISVSMLISCWISSSFLEYFVSREQRVKSFLLLICCFSPIVFFGGNTVDSSIRLPFFVVILMAIVFFQLVSILHRYDFGKKTPTT